jgi:1,4-alpha-glucan branching enzyme
VFNTEDARYGGSGISNGKGMKTSDIAVHGYNQSLKIIIPPLSVSFIKLVEKLEKPKKEATEKKKAPKKPAKKPARKIIKPILKK